MAENLPLSHEHHSPSHEHQAHHEVHKHVTEKAKVARHEHAENIEHIRAKAESEATKTQEVIAKTSEVEKHRPTFVNRELKSMAYQRTMKRIQRQLPAPSRAFSKVIHQPAVEAVSEVAGKTVARPSGVLAGGIVAFLGSSVFLWVARHYGYEYNFLLFAFLFVGGFFLGLIIELIVRSVRNKRV